MDSGAGRWVSVEISKTADSRFKQDSAGRPGEGTRYHREERRGFTVAARVREDVIQAVAASDGKFPLLSNCRDLSPARILEAYKFQPRLE